MSEEKEAIGGDLIKVSKIKNNPDNPRIIKDDAFYKLVNSIKEFPEMMSKRPIVIDSWDNPVILGGNMRFKAIIEAGYKEIPNTWVVTADGWTDDQKREFIIKDNVSGGEWSWDVLANEWDSEQLEDWGLEIPSFESAEEDDLSDKIKSQFKIEVVCKSEKEQEITYNKLIEEGYECRVLNL